MDWFKHEGGPCPISPDDEVILRCASGYESQKHKAGERHLKRLWEWAPNAKREEARIIAYRYA